VCEKFVVLQHRWRPRPDLHDLADGGLRDGERLPGDGHDEGFGDGEGERQAGDEPGAPAGPGGQGERAAEVLDGTGDDVHPDPATAATATGTLQITGTLNFTTTTTLTTEITGTGAGRVGRIVVGGGNTTYGNATLALNHVG
jgi:hypothetical protein